jgi:hypothetical protein
MCPIQETNFWRCNTHWHFHCSEADTNLKSFFTVIAQVVYWHLTFQVDSTTKVQWIHWIQHTLSVNVNCTSHCLFKFFGSCKQSTSEAFNILPSLFANSHPQIISRISKYHQDDFRWIQRLSVQVKADQLQEVSHYQHEAAICSYQ